MFIDSLMLHLAVYRYDQIMKVLNFVNNSFKSVLTDLKDWFIHKHSQRTVREDVKIFI